MLQRYELLYEAALVPETVVPEAVVPEAVVPEAVVPEAGRPGKGSLPGMPMRHDHRRILATGIARLRAKIKYRPVVFELMPPDFTLGQLQQSGDQIAHLVRFALEVGEELPASRRQ